MTSFRMEFFLKETPEFKYHLRIWRRHDIVFEGVLDTFAQAQRMMNLHLEKSMV